LVAAYKSHEREGGKEKGKGGRRKGRRRRGK